GVTGYDVYNGATLVGSSPTRSYTVTGLAPITAYTFTVKAKDAAGNVSAASTAVSVTTNADTEAPTVPTALSVASKTVKSVTLNWLASTDNIGVTGYDIYQGLTKKGSTSTTSYTVTGLAPNTLYTFTIRAKDAAGNQSTSSSEVSETTDADTQAPSVPTAFYVKSKTNSSISLAWAASTDNASVTGYDVYNGETLVGSTTTASYTVLGLLPTTDYTITVKAKDATGNISVASSGVSETTNADAQAPSQSTWVTVPNKTNTSVSFSWSPSTDNVGVIGYDIYSGTTKLGSTTTTSYTATGLVANTSYTFTVRAKDVDGNETVSTSLGITTNPDALAPVVNTLSVSSKTETKVSLNWMAYSPVNRPIGVYYIYNGVTLIGTSNILSFTVTGLTPNTSYNFTVKAVDGIDESVGVTVSVTTNADTQAPSVPTNIAAPYILTTSLSLTWAASTDNIGVVSYDVYNGTTYLGTFTTTSCTVNGLTPKTAYSFTVKARDAAGNVSAASSAFDVTTK
ncbi:MAG: fibronectin type III domain-containing protein, partial [Cohnella sp.]|nr:fibronectin type III domain-containing protein [Cohnella sp.]